MAHTTLLEIDVITEGHHVTNVKISISIHKLQNHLDDLESTWNALASLFDERDIDTILDEDFE